MLYNLSKTSLTAVQEAFTYCTVTRESGPVTKESARTYFYIHFNSPVELTIQADDKEDLIKTIFAGDTSVTEALNPSDLNTIVVSAAFHWIGDHRGKRCIYANGYALEVITTKPQDHFNADFFKVETLVKAGILKKSDIEHLKLKLSTTNCKPTRFVATQKPRLFKRDIDYTRIDNLIKSSQYAIKQIETVNSKYQYDNEKAINPAYENITKGYRRQLSINENRIWLLRGDLELVTGIKNAYRLQFHYTGLEDNFDTALYPYIGWDDRYGHPSLTIPEPEHNYDGSTYYAGYIAQRSLYLEILLFSGRYYRTDISPEQRNILEAYVALHFIRSYGQQEVVFIDISGYRDYYDLSLFLSNKPFPNSYTRRHYDLKQIESILSNYIAQEDGQDSYRSNYNHKEFSRTHGAQNYVF